MTDFSKSKAAFETSLQPEIGSSKTSNPLSAKISDNAPALQDYSQSMQRPKYDKDILEIIEVVRILNNMAPVSMPVYNFNIEEINGERYYKPDGSLLLIREYDSDVIRDYYASAEKEGKVDRILEHDKITGRLRAKIDPIKRAGSRLTTNIMIFDFKVNQKYTLIQLSEGGIVSNITDFSGKGKSFQTLFRNVETLKPARYLEGKDSANGEFEMLDCIFDSKGNIARIKKYTKKREINIDYTDEKKNITVKTKVE